MDWVKDLLRGGSGLAADSKDSKAVNDSSRSLMKPTAADEQDHSTSYRESEASAKGVSDTTTVASAAAAAQTKSSYDGRSSGALSMEVDVAGAKLEGLPAGATAAEREAALTGYATAVHRDVSRAKPHQDGSSQGDGVIHSKDGSSSGAVDRMHIPYTVEHLDTTSSGSRAGAKIVLHFQVPDSW